MQLYDFFLWDFFSFCELGFIFCSVFFLLELSAVLVRELLIFWLFHFFYSQEKCFQSPLFSLVLTYRHPPTLNSWLCLQLRIRT